MPLLPTAASHEGRAIPRARPRLSWEARVPPAWSGFLEIPVVHGDLVLLSAGWDRPAGELGLASAPPGVDVISADETARRPVLVALDAGEGRERFRVEVPEHGLEGATGLPGVLGDGRILLPVYQKDVSLEVLALERDGGPAAGNVVIGPYDDRRVDLCVVGHDLSSKLFLAPAVPVADGFLVSWLYRQLRFYRTELRRPGETSARWTAPEWLLAVEDGVALGVRVPDAGGETIAREAATGDVLWSLGPNVDRTVAAAGGGRFVLVDHAAREIERVRREHALLEAQVGTRDESVRERRERDFLAANPLARGAAVVSCDARSGNEAWRAEVPGDVIGVASNPRVLCLLFSGEDGTGRIRRLDARGGTPLGDSTLEAPIPVDPRRGPRPRLVAVDHTHLLYATDTELVCEVLAEPGAERWRMPLPAPCAWFRPRTSDRRFEEASIVVDRGRVVMREGERVWCYAEDG